MPSEGNFIHAALQGSKYQMQSIKSIFKSVRGRKTAKSPRLFCRQT